MMLMPSPVQVWSCSERHGTVHIWRTDTFERIQEWRLDCNGLNQIICTRGCVWGAGSNGSVYIWDLHSHLPVSELVYHNDTVRSLCSAGKVCNWVRKGKIMRPAHLTPNIVPYPPFGVQDFVVSGGASRDGGIVVWRTVAPGRFYTATGQPKGELVPPGFDVEGSQRQMAFDRYGFRRFVAANPTEAETLARSLEGDKREQYFDRNRAYLAHCQKWDEYMTSKQPLLRSDTLAALVHGGIPDQYRFAQGGGGGRGRVVGCDWYR